MHKISYTSIMKEKGGSIVKAVSSKDLILFTKQFRTMIRAGIPIRELLLILEKQSDNKRFKKVIGAMAKDIENGTSINETFKKYPKIFSNLYCSVIQAGERANALPDVLERLIYILEHEHKITSDIKTALRYPFIVLLFLSIAFFILLIFVVPKFVTVFKSKGLDLPLPTQICLNLYQMFNTYGHILFLSAVVITIIGMFWLKTESGRYFWDYIMINVPVLGNLFIKSAMSRFASIFAILQHSGVPILDIITILSQTIGNLVISREFKYIRDEIEKGKSISNPLKSAKYFTPMMVNMVDIGEKTEKLDEMLVDVSKHYDSEVEYAMQGLSDAVTPILTLGMAVVVGFFALAIFLPMWDMTKIAK